jgi:ankyrin repeat protein
MCGDFLIPTNIFALLPYLLGIEPDSHCQKILEIMPGAREEISSPDPCDESRGSWAYPDLLILLRNFKDSKSTEPKDKVYALLGLSVQHKHDRLVLDYAKSEEQIVRDTITSIIPAYPAEFLPEWKLDQFLDSVDSLLQVLLILAVEEDYNSAVQQLLETKTIEVDWVNSDGCTALYRAADIGRVEAVKLLLETDKVDVNHLHIHTQKTPLSVAAYRRHDSIVEMILETGRVDIDMYGVSNGLMDWVLPRRPDVHVESQEHKVETMIKAGLVNFKDSRGRSMLSLSAQSNHANNIKLLLGTEGVDVNTKDHAGRTPLIFAVNEGGKDAVELLLEAEGVEIDTKDRDGRTPLSFAAQCGDTDIVELLLSKEGIEVDAKDNTMRTPLSWAAAERVVCFHTVRLLLESGKVDVNSTDQLERTPLSWASEGGDIEIVRLLLEKGKAEIDSKDLNGRSPLSTAHEYGHQDVVEILREQMPLG